MIRILLSSVIFESSKPRASGDDPSLNAINISLYA